MLISILAAYLLAVSFGAIGGAIARNSKTASETEARIEKVISKLEKIANVEHKDNSEVSEKGKGSTTAGVKTK